MRISHLHAAKPQLQAGLYACSPGDGRFQCTYEFLSLADNQWQRS